MQDAYDVDRLGARGAIQDEMPPAAPAARRVERAQPRENVIARPTARNAWTVRERT
jgi:hypothetical protein